MRRYLHILFSDFFGLIRVAGPITALRWLAMVLLNLRSCLRQRNLQPADLAMGHGPFPVRLGRARAKLYGEYAISGAREIWVRRVYLGDGFVSIRDGDTVVDLGCNMGNFSLLALGHGPRVRVISVEADPAQCEKFRRAIEANGWQQRANLFNIFLGGETPFQHELAERGHNVSNISQEEFLARAGLNTIDFLKVDIEGSEFALLTPDSPLLARTRQLAIEVHSDCGDVPAFLHMLEQAGFELGPRRGDATATIVQARRRTPLPA